LVAGLIAGNDNEYHAPGVAPDASIYAYRIFGCTGSTPDNLVIDAMLRAVRDECDVINLSLGAFRIVCP
jgi:subtilisin family serine protease